MQHTENLELLCIDRDTLHYKDIVAQRFAELVYFGQWYTPLREAFPLLLTARKLRYRNSKNETI